MTISVLESDKQTLENNAYEEREQNTSSWNGRLVVVNSQEPTIILCSNIVSGAIKDYFSSEKRQQNAFDIKLYQHHVRCNSEESKQHLEKAFEKMATGTIGVVIGVVCLFLNPFTFSSLAKGSFFIYNCKDRVWMGIEEFKKAMETRNVSVDNITFVTNAEDLKRNTEELVNHGIILQSAPFQSSGYQYIDNPNYINPLDTKDYHQPRNFNYNNPGYRNEGKKETQYLTYA